MMEVMPDGGMSVVHWTKDGRSAYFYSFLGGDGGECFYSGGDRGSGLFRIDLQSGQTMPILSPNTNFWWYGFSVSPTDRRLVYGVQAKDLKILDITTGELISINSASNFDEGGGFLWSSDGLKLVYSALRQNGEVYNYSLRLVDTQSGSERILLESTQDCFEAVEWTKGNVLTIEKDYGKEVIEFDLNSNSIIRETTPTPFP
jgi:Tol biopolymer transport system component